MTQLLTEKAEDRRDDRAADADSGFGTGYGAGGDDCDDAGVAADRERIRRYATAGDERAFAEIVSVHVAMVYAAARRQVRSAELAEEVTQAVFVLLARKAQALGPGVVVAAWLHRTAFYTARNLLRQQARRRRHERRASPMEPMIDPRATAPTWQRLAPALDAGVASLREADRQAIVLQFFRRQSLADVGRAMGISEDAAQMRVSRAVGKLRAFFLRAGVTLDTVSLTNVVWANAGAAVVLPAGLAGRVLSGVRVARAGPTAAGGVAAAVGRAMRWARVRTVTGAVAAVVVGVVGTTFVLQRIVIHGPRVATAELRHE